MPDIRFIYNNLADIGTLTVNSEDADYPKENIQNQLRVETYRSTGVTNEWIKWDLGPSTYAITCMAFINHNFDAGATIKFQGNTTDVWSSPIVDETIVFDSNIMIKYFTNIAALQYWRISMTGGSGSYYDIGRIVFGTYFEPVYGINYDGVTLGKQFVDESITVKSIGLQKFSDIKNLYTALKLPFIAVTESEKNDFETFFQNVRKTKSFVVTTDPVSNLNASTYYGNLASVPPLYFMNKNIATFDVLFEESL